MRRIVVTGLIVFSALALSMVGGAADQRTRGVGAVLTQTPKQVEVTNFPAVQGVSGAVNVGNLPAVQTVSGSVEVANLPVDSNGNVRVSGIVTASAPAIHFVGFTQAMDITDVIAMNQECYNLFPGARACTPDELAQSIPPAPDFDAVGILHPLDAPYRCINHAFQSGCGGSAIIPAACCGF